MEATFDQQQQQQQGKKAKKQTELDPWGDPPGYLLAKGWELESGDPRDPASRWWDPTQPRVEEQTRQVVAERKQKGGKTVLVEQVYVTPAAWPVGRNEAVARQQQRDREQEKQAA